MAACYAAMSSYTYAKKAERLLKSRGIPCEIRRSENNSSIGCGYSLYIMEKCPESLEILKNYSIPYTKHSDGGV